MTVLELITLLQVYDREYYDDSTEYIRKRLKAIGLVNVNDHGHWYCTGKGREIVDMILAECENAVLPLALKASLEGTGKNAQTKRKDEAGTSRRGGINCS